MNVWNKVFLGLLIFLAIVFTLVLLDVMKVERHWYLKKESTEKEIANADKQLETLKLGTNPEKFLPQRTREEMGLNDLKIRLGNLLNERKQAWFGCRLESVANNSVSVTPTIDQGGDQQPLQLVEIKVSVETHPIEASGTVYLFSEPSGTTAPPAANDVDSQEMTPNTEQTTNGDTSENDENTKNESSAEEEGVAEMNPADESKVGEDRDIAGEKTEAAEERVADGETMTVEESPATEETELVQESALKREILAGPEKPAMFLGSFLIAGPAQKDGERFVYTLVAVEVLNDEEVRRLQELRGESVAVYTAIPTDRQLDFLEYDAEQQKDLSKVLYERMNPEMISKTVPQSMQQEYWQPDRPIRDYDILLSSAYRGRADLHRAIKANNDAISLINKSLEEAEREQKQWDAEIVLEKKRIETLSRQRDEVNKKCEELDGLIQEIEKGIQALQQQNREYVGRIADIQLQATEQIEKRAEEAKADVR